MFVRRIRSSITRSVCSARSRSFAIFQFCLQIYRCDLPNKEVRPSSGPRYFKLRRRVSQDLTITSGGNYRNIQPSLVLGLSRVHVKRSVRVVCGGVPTTFGLFSNIGSSSTNFGGRLPLVARLGRSFSNLFKYHRLFFQDGRPILPYDPFFCFIDGVVSVSCNFNGANFCRFPTSVLCRELPPCQRGNLQGNIYGKFRTNARANNRGRYFRVYTVLYSEHRSELSLRSPLWLVSVFYSLYVGYVLVPKCFSTEYDTEYSTRCARQYYPPMRPGLAVEFIGPLLR